MITLSDAHAAARAAAALFATLNLLNSGATGAVVSVYASGRPAVGGDAGAAPLVTFTLQKPAGAITSGVLTLSATDDGLITSTGVAVWARVTVGSTLVFDCDVTDNAGTGTIKLATTQLYAGGSVRMTSGVLS